jgi:hypothetical protein
MHTRIAGPEDNGLIDCSVRAEVHDAHLRWIAEWIIENNKEMRRLFPHCLEVKTYAGFYEAHL